ncbi:MULTISPECIES: hypothetical protein [unclassified Marinobacter]|jgi:hypothetical protein|uniref:hypothetical protein n=1 Tax=unclassified Marinobacter TaxID=83889 RepID=UPI00200CFA2C|nr:MULTISPECIES: hypothetical protein [unclassified Marinobacter]UQG54157.1 hypothetical protein MIH16_11855 [Marinobacter sp. M4C]UQG62964.1 hypothetical protein MIH17_11860 [Marinobacter sp. M2C]UQG67242.1 hypothetical protein MIH19_11855 [Marinobacter sp. M1C]
MLKPNSFLVTIGTGDDSSSDSENPSSKTFLRTRDINPFYIRQEVHPSGDFELFFGERKDSKIINFKNPVNGTSITYSVTNKKLIVRSDLAGAEPIYYRTKKSIILLSNRLDNLIDSDDSPNWEAIHCYLAFGYTVGESTFFKGIQQTLSNQKLEVDTEFLAISKEVSEAPPHTLNSDTLTTNGRTFAKLFSNIMLNYRPMALMMSAGWDSRTLLAPRSTPIKTAYTHGDLSSRECTIAKKLSGSLRTDHYFKDVKGMIIDTPLLDEMLELHGHCLWPIWHLSSKFISERLCLPIASGVIGARLGGHNGFTSVGTRFQKTINAAHLISAKIVSKDKIINDVKASMTAPKTFWFTSEKGNQIFGKTAIKTTKKIHQTLDDYLDTTDDFSFAIEKFNYDHASRQYMMKQPGMAKAFQGYYSPLSHPELLNLVYTVPFKQRVQNRLTRQVISELNRDLLEFPMAATLVKAKRPIFTQELSRILRIIFERTIFKLKKNRPNLGWFNYEHLYSGNFFETAISSLKSDIWSKERMLKTIASNQKNGIDAGSTMDMVCKIKTIDYYLFAIDKAAENERGVHDESH